MRGTPFAFSGFVGGLNTVDSPYTLSDTESPDLLNVVTTTRGSIRKRNGSIVLTALDVTFPALGVTDNFNRTELGANWSTIPGTADPGKIKSFRWQPSTAYPSVSGGRWNVAEQANPAVSYELEALPDGTHRSFGLWCCLSALARSGYFARSVETEEGSGRFNVTIELWAAGTMTAELATLDEQPFEAGDTFGVTCRKGQITVWRHHAGVWHAILQASDMTYTKGYAGIEAAGTFGKYGNFSLGETAAGLLEGIELHSIFAATINGTKLLIAAGGGKLFSISSAGIPSQIGSGFNVTARWSVVQAPASTLVASQGPVYMINGIDPPQYWTGTGEVKAWTGATSEPTHADGKSTNASAIYEAASSEFYPTDVGLVITGTNIPAGTTVIKYISATQIELSQAATGSGSGLSFMIKRQYYATSPHVPNGQWMVFAGNRIWMTGVSGDTSAVWFSDIVSTGETGGQGDPSSWTKTNFVRFDSSDGYPITGLGTVGPYLVVFKENKTWVITDLNTGANRRLADNIGCVSHRSIVETALGTFFLTADQGVYLTDGAHLHEMSYNVRPTILGLNPSERQNAAAIYYNNHYYLSFASGGSATNNRTLDYDVQLKSWWLHDLCGNQWVIWEPAGETNLYACPPGESKGVVRAFVPNVYTDSGAKYPGANGLAAYWRGSWQVFWEFINRHRIPLPDIKKRVRSIHFDGTGEIIPIVARNFSTISTQEPGVVGSNPQTLQNLPINFSSDESTFGSEDEEQIFGSELFDGQPTIFGGACSVNDARLYSLGVARAWSVGFGNNSAAPFEINSFTYRIQFRKS